ncbi:uncharacterized protein LOC126847032 isoform X2 [Adelges cooleyi]|uniref:uncharacterized protein LOC126847032 isoform X2 n=1 Tax=Adelges cooleyi TaxID=133065 RepID=UPI0021805B64|nr:uncharacterized protein LOC126847032 isoform X2 [Adelges cooleyi]
MVIKMTLFCILLTFVFVSVSENDDVTYKKIVFLTNAAIEQAFAKNDLTVGNNSRANGLEHIIEKIIDDWYTYWSFAEINMMIAAPDKLDLADHRSALSRFFPRTVSAIQYQLNIRKEIKDTLDIDISDALYREDSEGLNLTTLAEHRRRRVKTALKNIFRRKLGPKYNQFMMQLKLEVRNTLTNEISEDLGRLNLTTLIEERRLTGTSIANTIRRGVLGTDTSEVVEEESGSVPNVFLWRLCRLIGLYISAQFPRSYIRQLWSDPDDNTCILDDGTTLRRFKKINDLWWQLSPITRGAVNII